MFEKYQLQYIFFLPSSLPSSLPSTRRVVYYKKYNFSYSFIFLKLLGEYSANYSVNYSAKKNTLLLLKLEYLILYPTCLLVRNLSNQCVLYLSNIQGVEKTIDPMRVQDKNTIKCKMCND